MITTLLIIAMLILPIYLGITYLLFKELPASLSQTYYWYGEYLKRRKFPKEMARIKELNELIRVSKTSDSDYCALRAEREVLRGKVKSQKGWSFQLVIGLLIATLAPCWFELGDSVNVNATWLGFLSCVSLAGVAIKANYLFADKNYHYAFTAIAAVLSLIWVNLVHMWYVPFVLYPLAGLVVYYLFEKQPKFDKEHLSIKDRLADANALLLIEMAAFYSIMLSLLFIWLWGG